MKPLNDYTDEQIREILSLQFSVEQADDEYDAYVNKISVNDWWKINFMDKVDKI